MPPWRLNTAQWWDRTARVVMGSRDAPLLFPSILPSWSWRVHSTTLLRRPLTPTLPHHLSRHFTLLQHHKCHPPSITPTLPRLHHHPYHQALPHRQQCHPSPTKPPRAALCTFKALVQTPSHQPPPNADLRRTRPHVTQDHPDPSLHGMRPHVRHVESMVIRRFVVICLRWHFISNVIARTGVMQRPFGRMSIDGWSVTSNFFPGMIVRLVSFWPTTARR